MTSEQDQEAIRTMHERFIFRTEDDEPFDLRDEADRHYP